MDDNQSLGDLIKAIEREETNRRSDTETKSAVYIRIDGNRFSKFTRGMKRPYDPAMSNAMIQTTQSLIKTFGAVVGYTQSDEISLILWPSGPDSQIAHNGKFQKLVSRTASHATSQFRAAALSEGLGSFVSKQEPEFDSRAFAVNKHLTLKALLWRMIDCHKNATQMVAQTHLPHRSLQGKHGDDQIRMLSEIGIDYSLYPAYFRLGTLLAHVTREVALSPQELDQIPETRRPTGPIHRRVLEVVDPYPNLRTAEGRNKFIEWLEAKWQ